MAEQRKKNEEWRKKARLEVEQKEKADKIKLKSIFAELADLDGMGVIDHSYRVRVSYTPEVDESFITVNAFPVAKHLQSHCIAVLNCKMSDVQVKFAGYEYRDYHEPIIVATYWRKPDMKDCDKTVVASNRKEDLDEIMEDIVRVVSDWV